MFATECALRGCTVTLAVRAASMKVAEQVAAHIRSLDAQAKVEVMDIERLDGSQAYELMINATPVGMYPNVQHSPVDERALRSVKTCLTAFISGTPADAAGTAGGLSDHRRYGDAGLAGSSSAGNLVRTLL